MKQAIIKLIASVHDTIDLQLYIYYNFHNRKIFVIQNIKAEDSIKITITNLSELYHLKTIYYRSNLIDFIIKRFKTKYNREIICGAWTKCWKIRVTSFMCSDITNVIILMIHESFVEYITAYH